MTQQEAIKKARRIWGKRAYVQAAETKTGPIRWVGFISRVIPAFCVQGRADTWEAAFREWDAMPDDSKKSALWECGKGGAK